MSNHARGKQCDCHSDGPHEKAEVAVMDLRQNDSGAYTIAFANWHSAGDWKIKITPSQIARQQK